MLLPRVVLGICATNIKCCRARRVAHKSVQEPKREATALRIQQHLAARYSRTVEPVTVGQAQVHVYSHFTALQFMHKKIQSMAPSPPLPYQLHARCQSGSPFRFCACEEERERERVSKASRVSELATAAFNFSEKRSPFNGCSCCALHLPSSALENISRLGYTNECGLAAVLR